MNASLGTIFFKQYANIPEDFFNLGNCSQDVARYFPSSREFFIALGPSAWIILGLSSAALFTIVLAYIINIIYACRKIQSKYLFSTNVVLSAYTGIAICTFLQIFVPRANLILDIISNLWLVFCLYHFFKLTIGYYGGQQNMVICLEGKTLPWRGPPCCCWPCVWPCLPQDAVHKGQVKFLALLVLQHPILQAFFAVVTVTMYIEGWVQPGGMSVFDPYFYINIATMISFLFALWGFLVLMKCSKKPLSDFSYTGKVISLQLCILFVRFQTYVFSMVLLPTGIFPCIKPISPGVYGNLVLKCLILGQLVTLSVAASYFYRISKSDKKSCKSVEENVSNNNVSCSLL